MLKIMDLSKFNVGTIISNHVKTLKNQEEDKYSLYDLGFSFIAPLIIAVLLSIFGHPISTSSVGVIVTAFSVFAAFLLNILVVLFTMVERAKDGGNTQDTYNGDIKKTVIKETYHNISFALLLSIFIVVLTILLILLPTIYFISNLIAGIGDFLIFIFIATILLILKRINAIISKEFT